MMEKLQELLKPNADSLACQADSSITAHLSHSSHASSRAKSVTAQAAVIEKCQQDSRNVCVGSDSGASTSTATTNRYSPQHACVTRAQRSTRGSETNMVHMTQPQTVRWRGKCRSTKAEASKDYAYHGICYL